MRTVSIRELKDGLAGILREATEGARIRVTNHGQVVALLSPDVEEPEHAAPKVGEVIGTRIKDLHRLLNSSTRQSFCLSRMAAILELERPVDLERLISADADATFAFLDKLAATFGACPDWIKYGARTPFYTSHSDMMQDGDTLLKNIEAVGPKTLYFLKDTSNECRATIVAEVEPHRFQVIFSPIHVSSVNGQGGAGRLLSFYELVTLLQNRSSRWSMFGGIVHPDTFSGLMNGNIWPGKVCFEANQSTWWDDFSDISGRFPAVAPHYENNHGKGFMEAQEIVRCHIKERTEKSKNPRQGVGTP